MNDFRSQVMVIYTLVIEGNDKVSSIVLDLGTGL